MTDPTYKPQTFTFGTGSKSSSTGQRKVRGLWTDQRSDRKSITVGKFIKPPEPGELEYRYPRDSEQQKELERKLFEELDQPWKR